MKRLSLLFVLGLASSLAVAAQPKGAVYSPMPGVVCADSEGISLGYTKEYLGEKAEATVMGRIKDAGGVEKYDLTWFGFSNGVDCKVKEKVCHVSKYSDKVDKTVTKALFGR